MNGFVENTIPALDNISNSFGEGETTFPLTRNSERYEPIADEYVIAIYDNQLSNLKLITLSIKTYSFSKLLL